MSKPFDGTINIDIRDSTPDWEPFLLSQAPEGAPNVLMIVWDAVRDGAMDVFGGRRRACCRPRRPDLTFRRRHGC